jgi:hypothetical protein
MNRSPTSPTSPQARSSNGEPSTAHDGERLPRDNLGSHKRSVSGSLFSKLSFLKGSQAGIEGSDKGSSTEHLPDGNDGQPTTGGALAGVLQQQKKTRKRKGSLRKTALLGTGVLRLDSRDKKSPTSLKNSETLLSPKDDSNDMSILSSPTSPENEATPRPSYEQPNEPPAIDRTQKPQLLVLNSTLRNGYDHSSTNSVRSPTEASTTDEDDFITFPRIPTSLAARKAPSISSSDSYFPLQPDPLSKRRASHRIKSPLATHPVEPTNEEEWDYGQTEFWGWIILIVTWIVFAVGMGSCLDVWVWSWDVGETPEAPPELEDDPTLPIVGYYPALLVCTGVMSWIWAISSWLGMKYFKHANIPAEDRIT